MFRVAFLTVALVSWFAVPLSAQSPVDQEISDLALVMTVTYENLGREHNAEAISQLLDSVKEPLRGTPYRLLKQVSKEADTKQALLGKPVPKPENQFRLAVLHPNEPKVVFVCDKGVIVIQDISEPDAKAVTLVTSRAKPLAYGAFSSDGKFFAVGDSEGGVVIWDTTTWKESKVLDKWKGIVSYVGLDKTGDKLIVETDEGLILWDVAADKEIGNVRQRLLFGGAFCFSDDQHHFATGGLDSVVICDVATGKKLRAIGHATHTMQLAFSSDGSMIASGLRGVPFNKHVGVFDVATGKTIFDHAEHGRGITGVVFLDQDKCVLSTAADGTMKFWHVPSGTELLRMKFSESIYQPTCHANGSTILWNQRSGPRYFSVK